VVAAPEPVRLTTVSVGTEPEEEEVQEMPPPVPKKDRSVGARTMSPQPAQQRIRRIVPRMIPIPLTPPPMSELGPASPSSLSDSISFLSSHHSDDLSLLESEQYPPMAVYPRSESPWSASSASSSYVSSAYLEEDEGVQVVGEEPERFSIGVGSGWTQVEEEEVQTVGARSPSPEAPTIYTDTGVEAFEEPVTERPVESVLDGSAYVPSIIRNLPSEISSSELSVESSGETVSESPSPPDSVTVVSDSAASEGTYLSRSSSPSTASASSTSTAIPPTRIFMDMPADDRVREMLDQLKNQTAALRDGQLATNGILEELRYKGAPPEVTEALEKLAHLEGLLNLLLSRGERAGPVPPPPTDIAESVIFDSGSETSSAIDRLRQRWEELNREREEPLIYVPTPIRAGPTLDEQMAELLNSTGQFPPAPVEHPPPLIPLVYRPIHRATRPRSASPTSFMDLPRRSASVPISEPDSGDFPSRGYRLSRRPGRGDMSYSDQHHAPSIFSNDVPPSSMGVPRRRSRRGGEGPDDFLREVLNLRDARRQRAEARRPSQPVSTQYSIFCSFLNTFDRNVQQACPSRHQCRRQWNLIRLLLLRDRVGILNL
jgi:hypothetical protein